MYVIYWLSISASYCTTPCQKVRTFPLRDTCGESNRLLPEANGRPDEFTTKDRKIERKTERDGKIKSDKNVDKEYSNGENNEDRRDINYILLFIFCNHNSPSISLLCSSLSQATTIKKSRELYRHTVWNTGSKQHLYNHFNNGGTTVALHNMQRNKQAAFERKIACKLKAYNCVYRTAWSWAVMVQTAGVCKMLSLDFSVNSAVYCVGYCVCEWVCVYQHWKRLLYEEFRLKLLYKTHLLLEFDRETFDVYVCLWDVYSMCMHAGVKQECVH